MYIATTVSIKKRAPLKTKMEQKNIALKICTAPEKRKCLKKLLFGFGARSLFRSELLRFEGVFFFFILASISKQHHVQVPVLLACLMLVKLCSLWPNLENPPRMRRAASCG